MFSINVQLINSANVQVKHQKMKRTGRHLRISTYTVKNNNSNFMGTLMFGESDYELNLERSIREKNV